MNTNKANTINLRLKALKQNQAYILFPAAIVTLITMSSKKLRKHRDPSNTQHKQKCILKTKNEELIKYKQKVKCKLLKQKKQTSSMTNQQEACITNKCRPD